MDIVAPDAAPADTAPTIAPPSTAGANVVKAFVEEFFGEGVDQQLAGLAAEQLVNRVGVL